MAHVLPLQGLGGSLNGFVPLRHRYQDIANLSLLGISAHGPDFSLYESQQWFSIVSPP